MPNPWRLKKARRRMILARWRTRRANRIVIDQIHGEIVAAARAPELFQEFAVRDDLDGRFEMLTLHAGLVLRRLRELGSSGEAIAQDLFDCLFRQVDDALREMAISDVGVAKRIKAMAEAFYGRSKAYHDALSAHDREALAAALARNVYREPGTSRAHPANALASRAIAFADALEQVPIEAFAEGHFKFPNPAGGPP
jgi:cytochrome b pre-mRNA-processing protein 3